VCILLVLITWVYHNARFKKRKESCNYSHVINDNALASIMPMFGRRNLLEINLKKLINRTKYETDFI